MNIENIFPSRWLDPDDLSTKRFTLEIASVELEEVYNRQTNSKEKKLALSFKGAKKQMLLNKTQAFKVAEIANSGDTDNWPGHSITIRAGVAPNKKPTIVVEAPPVITPVANEQ